jgi:hypothetical protein
MSRFYYVFIPAQSEPTYQAGLPDKPRLER